MTSNKTIADVFSYFDNDLPGILDGLADLPCLTQNLRIGFRGATEFVTAPFNTREELEALGYEVLEVVIPSFTNESYQARMDECFALSKLAYGKCASLIHDKANALLAQLDDAAMTVYKQLLDLKIAEGLDGDTAIDQIDGEYSINASQLDELWSYWENG